jgi:hypothetical protein
MDGIPQLYRNCIKIGFCLSGAGSFSGLWRGHVDSEGGIFGEGPDY